METLKPIGDGVLVKVSKADDTSKGGIIIPDAAKEKPRRGEVLAVGPGQWEYEINKPPPGFGPGPVFRPVSIQVGQVVLFSAYAGTKVGEDLLLLKESDLLAVVAPADAPSKPITCD